jgi:hypothetical protein
VAELDDVVDRDGGQRLLVLGDGGEDVGHVRFLPWDPARGRIGVGGCLPLI